MNKRIQSLRGFHDLVPGETEHWRDLEGVAHSLCGRYGFREIRPAIVEPTELFVRSVGASTDIVGKEMFSFGPEAESVSLRPEITASVCRAYLERGLSRKGSSRLYYVGPGFRRERPQKGRLRQFHQIGIEVFGEPAPVTDAEVLALGRDLVETAGVSTYEILINSLGDDACRPQYREILVRALSELSDELCDDCQRRIDRNPLRVLDCKKNRCRERFEGLPKSADHLCGDCREHFDGVRNGLAKLGIEARLDPTLVRGLDYYVRTSFEIRAGGLGAQNAVLGGGRYDGLVEQLGGPPTPAIGWAAGIERILIAAGLADQEAPARLDAYLVTLGDLARERALGFVQELRHTGLSVGWDTSGRGLGGQMKRADRSGARFAVLIGDDELERGSVTLKDLTTGEQSEGPPDPEMLAEHLFKLMSFHGAETRRQ